MPILKRSLAAAVPLSILFSVIAACDTQNAGEDNGATSSAVWDLPPGQNNYADASDTDDLSSDIVVSLSATATGPTACTGTLLSGKLVLTAASCKSAGKAGPTPFVRVGGRVPFQQTVSSTAFLTFAANPATEPSLSGQDVGIVVLSSYVLTPARPYHPPFAAPAPTGTRAASGLETFTNIGISGWSPYDASGEAGTPLPFAQTARQDVQSATISLYRYWTISAAKEPLWVLKPYTGDGIPQVGLANGDNGGPLFVLRSDGHRDIIGVASILGDPPDPAVRGQALSAIADCAPITPGTATSCTAWVDVTSSAVQTWLQAQAKDTTRGARWLTNHPRVGSDQGTSLWIGDADYYGPCQTTVDSDCDHIWNVNANNSARDNCPAVANTDQIDSDDDGIGDACDTCPHSNTVCASSGGAIQCGGTTDTCGQAVDCGGCAAGLTCVANKCQQCQTCADLHATCGTVTNNCGQSLTCGTCASNAQCQANQCAACATTCPSTWHCGTYTNSCGQTIACGSCGTGICTTAHTCVARVVTGPCGDICGDTNDPMWSTNCACCKHNATRPKGTPACEYM